MDDTVYFGHLTFIIIFFKKVALLFIFIKKDTLKRNTVVKFFT